MANLCVEFGRRRRFFHQRLKLRRLQSDAHPAKDDEYFLPHPQETGKLTLVLDLDETLVYIKCARGCLFNCCCSEGDEFYIAKRPGVDQFLCRMAQLYEVVLWTASPQAYADGALELLDPGNKIFSSRLYRQHLDESNKKDLSRLGRDLSRVIMVDDCRSRFSDDLLRNVILVDKFIADGSPDDELETKLPKLLVELADYKGDVRLRLQQLQEQKSLDSSQRSSGTPWRPSWRRCNQVPQQQLESVIVETPVYIPAPSEDKMGEPSLLFGVSCSP